MVRLLRKTVTGRVNIAIIRVRNIYTSTIINRGPWDQRSGIRERGAGSVTPDPDPREQVLMLLFLVFRILSRQTG